MASYPITLKEVCDVADGTRLFVFGKPEGYVFKAGQYVCLIAPKVEGIELDKKGLARSFSLSSAPYESELYFTMRSGESSFKQTCWQLKPGDTVTVTGPVGFFVLPPEDDARPIIFLVGGIGITPVRSILKQAEHDASKRRFTLIYANRFLKDAAFHDELKGISLPDFRYVTVLSKSEEPCAPTDDERGYICEETVRKYVDDVPGSLYYIVGSPQFTGAMEEILANLGVSKEQCKKDPFTGLKAQAVK